jgi:hypothetical protein
LLFNKLFSKLERNELDDSILGWIDDRRRLLILTCFKSINDMINKSKISLVFMLLF